jgi:hypothetical protein
LSRVCIDDKNEVQKEQVCCLYLREKKNEIKTVPASKFSPKTYLESKILRGLHRTFVV